MTNVEYVDACRELCQIELDNIKWTEERSRGEHSIQGLDIEYQLAELARIFKLRNRDHFHGMASMLDLSLDPEAKRVIFGSLGDLLALRPARGSVWVKAFMRVTRRKQRERERRQRTIEGDSD